MQQNKNHWTISRKKNSGMTKDERIIKKNNKNILKNATFSTYTTAQIEFHF